MKKKLSTILTVLLVAIFTISTADAGGGIKISSATFSLGSLIAEGVLQGSDQETITVILEATGSCTIGEQVVTVNAKGSQILFGNEESETNQRPFQVETTIQDVQGCSNNPDLEDGFVFWKNASISVFSGVVDINPCEYEFCEGLLKTPVKNSNPNPLLVIQNYTCTTNQDAHTVSCIPINKGSSNNGAVAICHATGSNKKPYVLLTVSAKALNGHSNHANDIIPAPANGCP